MTVNRVEYNLVGLLLNKTTGAKKELWIRI